MITTIKIMTVYQGILLALVKIIGKFNTPLKNKGTLMTMKLAVALNLHLILVIKQMLQILMIRLMMLLSHSLQKEMII